MRPLIRARVSQLLYLSLIYTSLLLQHVRSVSFNFNFSDKNAATGITFEGDAHFNLDRISLTGDDPGTNIHYSKGRATYNQSVPLWDINTGEVTNFTTRFSFLIQNITPSGYGDGLAFFLSPYPSQIPADGAESCLGLCSKSIWPSTKDQIIAVEFDTYSNSYVDPNSTDCHIGIDVNSIKSQAYTIIKNSLFLGVRMTAQIEYNSWQRRLSVLLWHDANPNINFSVDAIVDIRSLLPNVSAVGFSASTGGGAEQHHIFSWSFNSTLVKNQIFNSSPSNLKNNSSSLLLVRNIAIVLVVGIFVLCLVAYYLRRNCLTRKTIDNEMIANRPIDCEFEKGQGPRRFPYSDLVDATNNFSENNKLGEGGFGSVYRGVLKDENIHVAVKRVSKESKQGKKEYISEVKIISQLRHRNLVQLIGWCHDHGEFLLVYELMYNGSLDKHLYNKENPLAWPIRHNIALRLGSALLYLHEEWQQCVVHRDIKPSNIMLDSSFNAKLGDFGLARLTNHDEDLETTIVAGTKGYMAPECAFDIANASTQSDMFSFGIVLLEITCGRRPIVHQRDQKKTSLLVEWVWELYGKKALVEAVDGRLNGDFDTEEAERIMVVGLWCAHPEKSQRPSILHAMNVLQFQAPLPDLPPKMPVPIYTIPPGDLSMQLCTSSDATSSGVAAASIKSAPAIPSDSSWLLKQQPNTF
ncbi:receptor lectin kinase [Rhynchospora pubera]|uniref:non-specific serine/threonine protein kinase n=1 Tax=Rhynchospora pubera TaxID=906938 RepID=A0AAV8EAU2_9POAL|nr:receptor lectin kinase [Rhynchospora pubera]